MNAAAFHSFTHDLTGQLQARPEVLGLILLGSTAATHHTPDAHSDHDFFVIVPDQAAETYRSRVDWLPARPERIIHHYRDTQHGARVIYADGHLLEYAVFTPDEIALSRNHHARIAFDKTGTLEQCLAPTLQSPAPDVERSLSNLLLHLLVGVGRNARGEELAGRQQLQHAANDVLELVHALIPPQHPELVDDRNPWRRVEKTHPDQARELARILLSPPPQAARELLRLARQVADQHPAWNEEGAQAIEKALQEG